MVPTSSSKPLNRLHSKDPADAAWRARQAQVDADIEGLSRNGQSAAKAGADVAKPALPENEGQRSSTGPLGTRPQGATAKIRVLHTAPGSTGNTREYWFVPQTTPRLALRRLGLGSGAAAE